MFTFLLFFDCSQLRLLSGEKVYVARIFLTKFFKTGFNRDDMAQEKQCKMY